MKNFLAHPLMLRISIISLLGICTFGCATIPAIQETTSLQPVRDLKDVVGKWEGFISSAGGTTSISTTFKEDGTWASVIGTKRYVGTVRLINGRLGFKSETTGATGSYFFKEEKGKRILVVEADDGTYKAEYYLVNK